jgi:hypothetical protein
MHEGGFSEHIERMLDVMLCLPRGAWGLVLTDIDKKIGTSALQKIIFRACNDSDSRVLETFKRSIALFKKRSG